MFIFNLSQFLSFCKFVDGQFPVQCEKFSFYLITLIKALITNFSMTG